MTVMPNMNPSDPPPFYSLDELAFQNLCRDLLEVEEGILTCEIYGVRGQAQMGVDLIAYANGGHAVEVGQCKCRIRLTPRDIRDTTDEFLRHLEFWRSKNVRRYVLFAAMPLSRSEHQDEIERQVKRFAGLGMTFEAWSAHTLMTKLSPHPEIVWRYTRSEDWVRNICGNRTAGVEFHKGRSSQDGYPKAGFDMEREIRELNFFKRLFGFEAKREVREAVLKFYFSSRKIGKHAIKEASDCLSEEGGWLKVSVSKLRHALSVFGGFISVLFFLIGAAVHPVWWASSANFGTLLEMFVFSMVSMGMYMMTFFLVVNPYVQALRIRNELDRLKRTQAL
jgi:hypothetical protein